MGVRIIIVEYLLNYIGTIIMCFVLHGAIKTMRQPLKGGTKVIIQGWMKKIVI